MKRLISIAVLIGLAVLVTLAALENTGKVTVFLSTHRIDFSLNFAIVALFVSVWLVWFLLGVLRASGTMPQKLKQYFGGRKQQALLRANTTGLMALVMGDEQMADKALKYAKKTGEHNELSYLLRALSAIQADRLDIATAALEEKPEWEGQYKDALSIMKARIALRQTNYRLALELVQSLPGHCAKYPQVQKIKLYAQMGVAQWPQALSHLRALDKTKCLSKSEMNDATVRIYEGLVSETGTDKEKILALVDQLSPTEKVNPQVLKPLCEGLLTHGETEKARKLLEFALDQHLSHNLLQTYGRVAAIESHPCLPFVESLLVKQPENMLLLELAASVCEQEQLWGKAISRYEKVYARMPSITIASKLERLYDMANQPEKARYWREKLQDHLGRPRQLT